jgi:hypothetical protein
MWKFDKRCNAGYDKYEASDEKAMPVLVLWVVFLAAGFLHFWCAILTPLLTAHGFVLCVCHGGSKKIVESSIHI